MPHLMLFAPCQHVAYDAADNTPSLIGIFQGFTVSIATVKQAVEGIPTAIIETAEETAPFIPLRWTAFSLWRKLDEDANKHYTQICELLKPSGESSIKQVIKFQMTANFQRNTVNIQNFPIDQPGTYRLQLSLQEENAAPVFIAEYPIVVIHKVESTGDSKP